MPATRIKLIVTGDAERIAMAPSLQRIFSTDGNGRKIEYLPTSKAFPTTSMPISTGDAPSSAMKKLARRLVLEAVYGEDGKPADIVIAIDDLELANVNQPSAVVDHLKQAIRAELAEAPTQAERTRWANWVRERCSFHLLSPMLEAYFFGELQALVRARCAQTVKPRLANADVEAFESIDPGWLAQCALENASHKPNAPWWKHERHPKHYLSHLVSLNNDVYSETKCGTAALATLDWPNVPANNQAARFIRSLFADLSARLSLNDPLGAGTCASETWPGTNSVPAKMTLRNI